MSGEERDMHHQHIKRPEQTHDSDSDHHIPKHAHAGKLDVQCSGLPLYLQRLQTQLWQRQPLEEEELQTKCENCAKPPQALENEEKTIQEKPDNAAAQQYPQKVQAIQKKPLAHFLQAKLKIGAPNDKYEQEADRVADHVMRMPEPKVQRQSESEEEEEQIQTKPLGSTITPLIQRQAEPEEEEEVAVPEREEESTPILESAPTRDADELGEEEAVQTKSLTNKQAPIKAGLQNRIQSLKSGGQFLPGTERAFFEPRFGADFSNVRVHTNNRAADTAQSINARAFTSGRDVVFGDGQYSPGTSSGRKLLAHELTHVVQQSGRGRGVVRSPHNPDDLRFSDTSDNRGIVMLQPSPGTAAGTQRSRTNSSIIGKVVRMHALKAHLMRTPEFLGAIIIKILRGARVKVLGWKGSWYLVRYRGRTGWIHKNRIRKKTIRLSSGGTGSGTSRGEAELSGRG